MYIEKVLDLWVQLMTNGGKNKSVAFIISFRIMKSKAFHITQSCVLNHMKKRFRCLPQD